MTDVEITLSPVLGLRMVLQRARDQRLRWIPADPAIYDGGRPMVPWLYQHLDVALADLYVQFVADAAGGTVWYRALLTPSGAALFPMLDLVHDADVRSRRPHARLGSSVIPA